MTVPPPPEPSEPFESSEPFEDDAPTVRFARIAGFAPTAMPDVLRPVEETPSRRRWPVALAGVLVVAVLTGGAGVAWAGRGDVPRGTRVLGVELGGLTSAEAGARLRADLGGARRLTEPFTVSLAGTEIVKVDPVAIGLAVDVPATIASVTGSGRLIGIADVPPVVTVDEAKLHDVLHAAAVRARLATPGTPAAITYDGRTPKAVYPEPGRGIDARAAADAVTEAWARRDVARVALTETAPATTRADVDRLLGELAVPATAAPVTAGAFEISPEVIARSLVFAGDPLLPRIDEKRLRDGLAPVLAGLETEVRDASVDVDGGWPRVTESVTGRTVDAGALARDLLAVLPRTTDRAVTATFTETRPRVTTADVERLGITERLATYTTYGPSAVTDRPAGTLVKPGDTFSLHAAAGEDASPQLAATVFQAAYRAGLEIVEHRPHATYREHLPAVLEATAGPGQDLRIRDDSGHGVFVDVRVSGRTITVTLWGTRAFDWIDTEYGPRTAVTEPAVEYRDPGPDCEFEPGSRGFSQDAWRIFRKDGEEAGREKFSWTYESRPRIICGPGRGASR
ncbi:vancomycin resistance protein YoaR [Catenuloplanes nepalensis]|uniref:Vancomycin resistance protein YoaR n=1 Tax=Catenuloplanes nepalensis TaxID=587533 RepID=A0ABT9N294_9ACTN|nr:VanW family protein [Catenuloplanes nepalensis]MDP9797700.1 vancomycin resistance protein YoaR [Catenuloplanes nepalensis]